MKKLTTLRHPLFLYAISLIVLPYLLKSIGMIYSVATEIIIFAMVGLGFNLLLGYTGLVSFGHGAYFGLAAYAAALFQIHVMPAGFLLPLLFAVAFAALLGLIIGFLVLRRRGVYFSLLTLAFTAMMFYIVYRWTSFTGGENGLGGVNRPPLLGVEITNQLTFYYVSASLSFLVAWLMWRVVNSPFGRVLVAIRENEQRATFIGYPVQRYKLLAFVLSATVAGLGGSLFAFLKYFVSADLVHPTFSGEILAMSIVGGMRNFLGPPVGAAFYILFREILSAYTYSWLFYFGLLFMAFILFSPTGLIGLGERILAPFRRQEEVIAAMAARVRPQPSQELPALLRPDLPQSDGDPLLSCQGIVKRFGSFVAVANAEIHTHIGRLQSLIGPNGAGKTTLFNVLSGMYPPEAGTVIFLGERIDGLSPDQIVSRGLARSFQITNPFSGLTVYENLRLGIQAHHPYRFNLWYSADRLADVHQETQTLIRFLGLEGLEAAPVSSLSYGGQRLLEIGIALTAKPKALLLDEPLAGLAAAERERVIGLMQLLAKYMAVLVIEHDIDRVFAFSDNITVMNEGHVVVNGPPDVVRIHPEVQEAYLGSGRKVMVAGQKRRPQAVGHPVLELKNVNTFYGKSHILYDVSLEIRDNEVVALLGRNGAGKSSTLKSITGLARPRHGQIIFNHAEITGLAPEAIARLGIRMVPQGRRLFPNLTVAENLILGSFKRAEDGVHWDTERIFQDFPRIKERIQVRADVLSGGEQQMVAIARALCGNVKLLLLDEPFEGLSPALTEEVFYCINRLREEIPILLVEHDLDLALSLADRVYVLDRGQITHTGPAEPLLTDLDYRKQVLWV